MRWLGHTRQQGAGPADQTASGRGRCTCCSSSGSHGPAGPRCARQPAAASHSHGSSSPGPGHETDVFTPYGWKKKLLRWCLRRLPQTSPQSVFLKAVKHTHGPSSLSIFVTSKWKVRRKGICSALTAEEVSDSGNTMRKPLQKKKILIGGWR